MDGFYFVPIHKRQFVPVPPLKLDLAIRGLKEKAPVQRMIGISKGWYAMSAKDGKRYFNDLRFGRLSLESQTKGFVFSYQIEEYDNGQVTFTEVPKNKRDGKKLLTELWRRVMGN